MTWLAERQEVVQGILSTMRAKHNMMCFQTDIAFFARLAGVVVPHEAGDTQVLVQPGWILVLASLKPRIIEPCDINLYVFNHDGTDREWKKLNDTDHLLHIGLD